jgi:pyrroloquinoline quinone biosynthesis protein D
MTDNDATTPTTPPGLRPVGLPRKGEGKIAPNARPRLPRGVRLTNSAAQGGFVLLAPERVFKPDPVALEILKRCTGEATFAEIVDDLASTYSAPRERILADVTTLLNGLAEKRLLELG